MEKRSFMISLPKKRPIFHPSESKVSGNSVPRKKRWFTALLTLCVTVSASEVKDNLAELKAPPKYSFPTPLVQKTDYTIGDNTLDIRLSPEKKTTFSRRLNLEYAVGTELLITFRYRSPVSANIALFYSHPEKTEKKLPVYYQKPVAAATDWTDYSVKLPLPDLSTHCEFNIFCPPGTGAFELKDLSVTEVLPKTAEGRDVTVNGKPLKGICLDDSFGPFDLLAAKVFRFAVFRTAGRFLPIRQGRNSGKPEGEGGILYVGKAAEKSGILSPKELDSIRAGGYVVKIGGDKIAIAGKKPGGVELGAVDLLRHMGVELLACDTFRTPPDGRYELRDAVLSCNPGVPLRHADLLFRVIRKELRGYSANEYWGSFDSVGNILGTHTIPFLVSLQEMGESHPEYFALQSNGKRQKWVPGLNPFLTHFCFSNMALNKLIAARLIEVMRATPEGMIYSVSPGDGRGYCTCEKCKALGNHADRMTFWTNAIAQETAKVFPDKYLAMLSYVDTSLPERMKPAQNVLVEYCVYGLATWGSNLNYWHPYNDPGKKTMAQWEKFIPQQLGACHYPSNAVEMLNVWPAFYTSALLSRHFGEKKYRFVDHCFYCPTYSNGRAAGHHSFTDLGLYVQARLEIDPAFDYEAAITPFMKDYFGPAAAPMRRYFDIIQNEPRRRNWGQNCEEVKRGFITQELAEKCLKELDAAEKLAGKNTRYRNFVLKEKITFLWSYLSDVCRGRGNVSKENFQFYAAHLAEYCRICRERGMSFSRVQTKFAPEWFWETAVYKIGKNDPWYDDPTVVSLMQDPVKYLGESVPNVQQKTPDGIVIGAEGMLGAQSDPKCLWMRETPVPAKIVRRPSSGWGLLQTALLLEETPGQAVEMVITGIDNEKVAPAEMEILVNGKRIFGGAVPFPKKEWGGKSFTIPAGVLTKGSNDIVFRNITADTEKDGEGGAMFVAKRDYYWGWFIIEKIAFKNVK